MGAVPGSRLLSAAAGTGSRPNAFDVEPFRRAGRRVVFREVDRPLLVLGSTQREDVVDARTARRRGVEIVRRRSGGGAVLLLPGSQVWVDLWVPRDDPLWSDEPGASAATAGAWWARGLGVHQAEVHHGPSVPRAGAAVGSEVICFAGIGPGEISVGGRKVVGLAQWRSREGALVHGCVYRRWDPGLLVELLDLPSGTRSALVDALAGAVLGTRDLGLSTAWGYESLVGALPDGPSWDVRPA